MGRAWIVEQSKIIESLTGETITSLIGTEMAFRGGDEDGPPSFEDPSLPFLQVCPLYLVLGSGQTKKFITYQNDDVFGIMLSSELSPWEPKFDAGSPDSIYRTRALSEFPTGLINSVRVALDRDGDISEVTLRINGEPILLVAGEVHEQHDGRLEVVKGDESLLVFRKPELRKSVRFRNVSRLPRWISYLAGRVRSRR